MLINAVRQPAIKPDRQQICDWADRRLGVGFDQLLILADSPDHHADFLLQIYNADGGEVEQCGNGVRCAARYVWQKQLSDKPQLRIATGRRVIALSAGQNDSVCADMGPPDFSPPGGLLGDANYSSEQAAYRCRIKGQSLRIGVLSMGNPHAALVVEGLADYAVDETGKQIQALPCFPHSVNVGFMQVRDRGAIDLRVFERGVGETRACASGACAAMAVGHRWGLLDKRVMVRLPGGALTLSYSGGEEGIQQCGAARLVYDGFVA